MRFMKNDILPHLDFIDMNVCIDRIKGKQTKHSKGSSHKKHSAS